MNNLQAALLLLFFASSAVAQSVVTFGVLRVPYNDPADRLTGLMVAIDRVNRNNLIPGYTAQVEVYYYPNCDDTTKQCDMSATAKANGLAPFIANFSRFNAVLFPNLLVSDIIIDAAKTVGVPVVDPGTIRTSDLTATGVYLFEQAIETEITMLIRYMLMTHSCATTAIVYEILNSEIATYVQLASEAMTYGGFPTPATLTVSQSSVVGILDIFFGNAYRECTMFFTSGATFKTIMETVSLDSRFVAGKMKMFGWSHISSSVDGTTTPALYTNLFFPGFAPPLSSSELLQNNYKTATATWVAGGGPTNDQSHFRPAIGDTIGTAATTNGFAWYTRALYIVAVLGKISFSTSLNNIPASWAALATGTHQYQISVDEYPFFPPINKCKPLPFSQDSCACSVVTRTSFIQYYDVAAASVITLSDRKQLGEKSIAQVSFSQDQCVMQRSISNYPFRAMSVRNMDPNFEQGVGADTPAGHDDVEALFYEFVAGMNLQNPAPIRPWRLISAPYLAGAQFDDVIAEQSVAEQSKLYDPFVIVASGRPLKRAPSLTLMANMGTPTLEDDPLTSREDGWDENVMQISPSTADYIHSIAAYLGSLSTLPYTSIYVITSGVPEASLVNKSLQTFRLPEPKEWFNSTVGADWNPVIARWAGEGGMRPFIFVATMSSTLATIPFTMAAQYANVTFGLGIPEQPVESGMKKAKITVLNGTADVLWGSMLTEYWTSDNAYTSMMRDYGMPTAYVADPLVIKMVALFGAAVHLAQQTLNQQRTASQVLYISQSLSTADIPMGPFLNVTCSPEIIAANVANRFCQCKKGIRNLRVHSMWNRLRLEVSTKTKRFLYTQTTCGVDYKYFPPVDNSTDFLIINNNNSDNTGMIAGVAVAGSVFALGCIAVVLALACCKGRNNGAAPKDVTKPFAIVFTDIQASTALWSRTPATMSEAVDFHCSIIRRLISSHKGYEVKTIGDSFMVAFHTAQAAVLFAAKVQETLYTEEWPEGIDQEYREIIFGMHLEQQRRSCVTDDSESGTVTTPRADRIPNAPNSKTEYNSCWKGIRVRVGVHFGHGEIRLDPTTQGYDYFGTVVNTAARVEGVGHGGQTLVTGSVMEVLGSRFASDHGLVRIDLGQQPLRGLESKVTLIQLLPVRLSGRRFPPLRLEVEKSVDADTNVGAESTLKQSTTNSSEMNNIEGLASKHYTEYVSKGRPTAATAANNVTTYVESFSDMGGDHPNAHHHAFQAADNYNEGTSDLLHHFHFLQSLLSTCSESWKREALVHLASRWRVPGPTTSVNSLIVAMMGVSARAMNATMQRARTPSDARRGHHANITNTAASLIDELQTKSTDF